MNEPSEKLRILLYSKAYPPSLGGVETISVTLATQLVRLGHECIVVTETPENSDGRSNLGDAPALFPVYRRPSRRLRLALARECSLVHSNGASVAMYPYAVLAGRPFMWTHQGYQIQCVDGLGWVGDEHTPMTPLASLRHTLHTKGPIRAAVESLKMAYRRFVTHRAALNVACSSWVAGRLNAPRMTVAHSPFDLSRFKAAVPPNEPHYDFIFVGRFVNEKGILDLLHAFALLKKDSRFADSQLALVGDGPLRGEIEAKLTQLDLTGQVVLLGRRDGVDLVEAMRKGRVAIVPSRWEEPMGGVALELLASGRRLIVSQSGGLAECVQDVALTFPNGDVEALRRCMERAIFDPAFQRNHDEKVSSVLARFDERELTLAYVRLYRQVLSTRRNT